MNYVILIVASIFATHRLTVLVISDQITQRIRDWFFDRWNPSTTWTYVLTCPWCASMWVGAFVALGVVFLPEVWLYFALFLMFSSITGLIEEKR